MHHYTPARIRAAFGLEAVKLTTWHNTYGLAAGTHQPNGHRRYSLAEAASVAIVVRLSGDLGFIQHRPAIALANALLPHITDTIAAYARFGDDMLVRMDEARPGAVCRFLTRQPGGGWQIHLYRDDDELQAAWRAAGGEGCVIIDFAELIRATLIALSRPSAANV